MTDKIDIDDIIESLRKAFTKHADHGKTNKSVNTIFKSLENSSHTPAEKILVAFFAYRTVLRSTALELVENDESAEKALLEEEGNMKEFEQKATRMIQDVTEVEHITLEKEVD